MSNFRGFRTTLCTKTEEASSDNIASYALNSRSKISDICDEWYTCTPFRGCGEKIFQVTFCKFYRRSKKLSHFTKTQCDEPKPTYSIGKADAGCLCKSISKYCLLFWLYRAKCHLKLFSSEKMCSKRILCGTKNSFLCCFFSNIF